MKTCPRFASLYHPRKYYFSNEKFVNCYRKTQNTGNMHM